MKSHKINDSYNFIAGWYMKDTTLCDDLISYFNNEKTPKFQGQFVNNNFITIDKSKKNSLDAELRDDSLLKRYMVVLSETSAEYKKVYKYCDTNMNFWGVLERPNMQYYEPPHAGYHEWHTERTGHPKNMHRHLVYMTYLNDVTDAGETEWFYQKTKIKPEKGLTVIWPTDWTFTHRGISSPTQNKYIVTGWFYFVNRKDL